MYRGDGMRVVGGELRIDQIAAGLEQLACASEIRHVGVRFARVQRIAGQALFLRALDLGVPVGALDQPHVPAAPVRAGGVDQPVDHQRRALGIGLDHDAQAVPAGERGMREHLADDVEREFQPVGFLGIHRQRDALFHGQLREFQQSGGEGAAGGHTLGDLVARIERRQLDRDRRRVGVIGERPARTDAGDRATVVFLVALGGGGGERGFAQHVVGIAVHRVFLLGAAVQRLVDGLSHHELVAHDAHRLAHREADRRLAGAADQPLERAGEVVAGFLGEVHQLAGEHQAPGRGVDEQRLALAEVFLPVGIAELVADQAVGSGLVRNAQQRLGHAHQQHAFLAGKVVLAHEGFHCALVSGARPHPRHQRGGQIDHLLAFGRRQAGLGKQFLDGFGFVAQPRGGDARACGRRVGGKFGTEDGLAHGSGGTRRESRRLYAAPLLARRRVAHGLIRIRRLQHSCRPSRRSL